MDKYEYKLRADEIKALIAKGEYVEAASIADTIDWRRVKSVMMLCTVSDLYKINRRFEDARDMLLLAYDRYPGGRSIVYSLCELSIKMGEFVQAVEYYKEFVQVAPKDSGRYVLQYKLYEAQEVSLEERIAVLEELKAKDYTEKWAYELAYLYHRIGLSTKCVEECDELILWFGEGKYVLKAMELKMLHGSLTEAQQEKYNRMKGIGSAKSEPVQEVVTEQPAAAEESDIQVKLMNVGQYDTINMQKELAQNMKELWEGPVLEEETAAEQPQEEQLAKTQVYGEVFLQEEEPEKEDTIDPVTKAIMAPMMNGDTGMLDLPDEETADELVDEQETKVEEVFFGETGELDTTAAQIMEEMKQEAKGEKPLVQEPSGDMKEWYVGEKPTGFEKILGMEYDGQISMIMPESEQVEKQITGQIRLEDVLLEWEKMKKDSEQKRMEAVRQRVLEQTGAMFTEFDAATRDGLLEKLENGSIETEEVDESVDVETEELIEIEEESEVIEEPEEAEEIEEVEEIEDAEDVEEVEEAEVGEEEPEVIEEVTEPEEAEEVEKEAEFIEEAQEQKTEKSGLRSMSAEEQELFAAYIHSKNTKEQIIRAIDNMSLAAYTGNVLITGEEGMDTLTLAKNLIKEMQQTDSNFSGKVAKISGASLNRKGISQPMERLVNGALIVQNAGELKAKTIEELDKALQQDSTGIIVIFEDTKKGINKLLKENESLSKSFPVRIDLEALDNDTLVAYGRQYALSQEYSIDEMGVLALHTRIAERQTSDHFVTISEVKSIVDDAIHNANKKSIGHLFDVLFARRYDAEDMIMLKEKDFV